MEQLPLQSDETEWINEGDVFVRREEHEFNFQTFTKGTWKRNIFEFANVVGLRENGTGYVERSFEDSLAGLCLKTFRTVKTSKVEELEIRFHFNCSEAVIAVGGARVGRLFKGGLDVIFKVAHLLAHMNSVYLDASFRVRCESFVYSKILQALNLIQGANAASVFERFNNDLRKDVSLSYVIFKNKSGHRVCLIKTCDYMRGFLHCEGKNIFTCLESSQLREETKKSLINFEKAWIAFMQKPFLEFFNIYLYYPVIVSIVFEATGSSFNLVFEDGDVDVLRKRVMPFPSKFKDKEFSLGRQSVSLTFYSVFIFLLNLISSASDGYVFLFKEFNYQFTVSSYLYEVLLSLFIAFPSVFKIEYQLSSFVVEGLSTGCRRHLFVRGSNINELGEMPFGDFVLDCKRRFVQEYNRKFPAETQLIMDSIEDARISSSHCSIC